MRYLYDQSGGLLYTIDHGDVPEGVTPAAHTARGVASEQTLLDKHPGSEMRDEHHTAGQERSDLRTLIRALIREEMANG